MKLILNDHIENLGERGDSVVVKAGYANNFLLPKKLAYPDTPGNRRRFEQEQTGWEEMDLERRGAAEKLAGQLDGTMLAFERRAGEKDVLFGSVNVADIARELAEKGFEIDRKRIRLEHAIKELGSFELVVHIHRDIDVTLPVRVVRPGEDPNAAAPEFVAEGALEVSEEDEVAQAIEEGIETTAFHVVSEPEPEPEPEAEHEPEPEVEAESMDADELPKTDTDSDPR
jgi:large subunit ribosomal protein L9